MKVSLAHIIWGVLGIGLLLLTLLLLFLTFAFKSSPWDQFPGPPPTAAMDVTALTSALRLHKIDTGSYPAQDQGFQALVSPPDPRPERWRKQLDAVPLDPWGNPYQYRHPGLRNPDHVDVFSWGPDGVESGDDVGNWR